jgi:hypothetical protein
MAGAALTSAIFASLPALLAGHHMFQTCLASLTALRCIREH